MNIPEFNFIVVEFCDNDFAHDLREGFQKLVDSSEEIKFCPATAKKFLVAYVANAYRLRHILDGRSHQFGRYRKYLSDIRVTFCDKIPTYEPWGEGEQIECLYYDMHTKRIEGWIP